MLLKDYGNEKLLFSLEKNMRMILYLQEKNDKIRQILGSRL